VTGETLTSALGVDFTELSGLIAALTSTGHTLAVAESLTGGLITAALTNVPGASVVVRGGLVVYATDLKHSLAGVDAALLDRVGAVHPEVARELAAGARIACRADWGLGVTGVAGPDPQDGQPVGTVFSCLDTGDGILESADIHPGDRAAVRAAAVRRAVEMIGRALDQA
jgi:nicotinamide-nucleotide amidase